MTRDEISQSETLNTVRMHRVRIFIASPGDVAEERGLARAVIDKLRNEFRYKDRIRFETVAWDQPGAGVPQEADLTPQAAIAKGLPTPAQCDLVLVIFWSRMGTPLPAEYAKPNGSRYRSGTEWEFCNAMDAARKHDQPTLWLYRRTQVPNPAFNDPHYEEKKRQWHLVETFFQSFTDADGAILGGINPYQEPAEFSDQFEDHLRNWLDRRLSAIEPEPQPPPAQEAKATEWDKAPYPGLRAFLPDEAPIFFGRRQETLALLERLAAPEGRFVAVVGASGSGKSSLVAAGLLPALEANVIEDSDQWFVIRCKPAEIDDNPFLALAVQLAPHMEKQGWRAGELAARLAAMPSLLTERLGTQLRKGQDNAGDLDVVKLFETTQLSYFSHFHKLLLIVIGTDVIQI